METSGKRIKKILIVDDAMIARKVIRKHLPKGRDYEIIEAKDGLEGLNKFRETRPDITFLDLTMPVMNGITALAEMKKLDPEAVIIVLTADAQEKTNQKAMQLGATRLMKKPPKEKEIAGAIEEFDRA